MTDDAHGYRQLFDGFTNLKILIIGDVMIDAYIWGHVDRISPEAPVPVVMVKSKASRLGGAANVALNIKAMGGKPLLCSVVGEDDRGAEFVKLLRDEAIACEGIIRSHDRITTTKFRIIGNNVQMLRVDEEVTHPLTQGDESRILQMFNYMMATEKPDAVIFQDYDKGVLTSHLIATVIQKAKMAGIPVTVDPKRKQFHAYKGVTLFKPNFKELRDGVTTTLPKGYSKELEQAVERLQNEMEAHHQALVELNQGVLSRTEQIMRMFSHSRERLEEMLSDFGEVKQFIRSLYLFGRERIQEIEEGGMEKFYFKVYPKRGPLEGYFQVGKSFLASGFHQEAYFALKKAKDHFPPKNFMDKETETLVTEIEALYSQALSGSDDKWGSARFKARR